MIRRRQSSVNFRPKGPYRTKAVLPSARTNEETEFENQVIAHSRPTLPTHRNAVVRNKDENAELMRLNRFQQVVKCIAAGFERALSPNCHLSVKLQQLLNGVRDLELLG